MRSLTRIEQLMWLRDFLKEQQKLLETDLEQVEVALELEEEKVKKKLEDKK